MSIGFVAHQRPAAVAALIGENLRHQSLAGGLLLAIGALGNIVAMAVQRDQRPDKAVEHPVPADRPCPVKARRQINARHVGGIISAAVRPKIAREFSVDFAWCSRTEPACLT